MYICLLDTCLHYYIHPCIVKVRAGSVHVNWQHLMVTCCIYLTRVPFLILNPQRKSGSSFPPVTYGTDHVHTLSLSLFDCWTTGGTPSPRSALQGCTTLGLAPRQQGGKESPQAVTAGRHFPCVCVFIYVYIYTYIQLYIYIYTTVCMYIYIYIYVYIYI